MNFQTLYAKAPLSERTLIKHKFTVYGHRFVNDLGYACDYRIIDSSGCEIGMIRYYKGRKLAAYQAKEKEPQLFICLCCQQGRHAYCEKKGKCECLSCMKSEV